MNRRPELAPQGYDPHDAEDQRRWPATGEEHNPAPRMSTPTPLVPNQQRSTIATYPAARAMRGTSLERFTTDYVGIREVALDVDRCVQDLRTVRVSVAGLGDPAPAVFGEYGVPEAMRAWPPHCTPSP